MAFSSTFMNNTTIPTNEIVIEIDAQNRTIKIPKALKNLAVNGDHLSETIYFVIPRYFDNKDFTEHKCYIRWINAKGEYGETEVINTEYDDTTLKFGWLITNLVTAYPGDIQVSVQFDTIINGVEYQWQTQPATFTILKGIEESTIDPTGGDDNKYREIMDAINNINATLSDWGNIPNEVLTLLADVEQLKKDVKYLKENAIIAVERV